MLIARFCAIIYRVFRKKLHLIKMEGKKMMLEKLAKLAYDGASTKSISQCFNVEESQILEIIETDEYKKQLSVITVENLEQAQLLDKGWEGVESFAVSRVLNELQHNPDPDFALKAAQVANKAIRRNGTMRQNTPIQVNNNLQAVINIQPAFAKTLQDNYLVEDVSKKKFEKKITNALNPAGVKKLLAGVTSFADDFAIDGQILEIN